MHGNRINMPGFYFFCFQLVILSITRTITKILNTTFIFEKTKYTKLSLMHLEC